MDVILLKVAEVRVSSDRQQRKLKAVDGLAGSIKEVGLLNPIVVDKDHTLIAGQRRLEAVKSLGWDEIPCTVRDLKGLQAELAEIDENYVRNHLTEREACVILYRRKQIYEELHPETKHGGDRKSAKIKSSQCRVDSEPVKSFARDAAEKLGVSERVVERRVRIGHKVTPEAMAAFDDADEKFTQKEGLLLSRIAPEHQEEAARQYVAGEIRSIGEFRPDGTDEDAKPPAKPDREKPKRDIAASYHDPILGRIVADIKDMDKERPLTADIFLGEFASAVRMIIERMDWFNLQQYQDIFSELTEEQYQTLCETEKQAESCLHTFLNTIRKKMMST